MATLETTPVDLRTPDAPGESVAYVTSYYPGTANPDDARVISVSGNSEHDLGTFRATLTRVARISGRLIEPPGIPMKGLQLTVARRSVDGVAGYEGDVKTVRIGSDGRFSIPGISQGVYLLSARTTALVTTSEGPISYWASEEVQISGRDLESIDLQLREGMRVAGRVVLDGTPSLTGEQLSRLRIRLRAINSDGALAGPVGSVQLQSDLSFEFTGILPGMYVLSAIFLTPPNSNWHVVSTVAGDRESQDYPLEVRPGQNRSGAVVTLGNVPTRVSIAVKDADPGASDLMAFAFPVDPVLRMPGGWRVRWGVRSDPAGMFTLVGLPPGEYFIGLLPGVPAPAEPTTEDFMALATAATKVALRAGERRAVVLPVR